MEKNHIYNYILIKILLCFISFNLQAKMLLNETLSLHKKEYLNLDLSIFPKNLNSFHQIEIKINNSTSSNHLFYLSFKDNNSHSYWSQLNFKSTIVPGINTLSFDLHQLIGERGSVSDNRSLDLNRLKKVFVVISPDDTTPATNKLFKILSINVLKVRSARLPRGLKAFDFTKKSSSVYDGFFKVTRSTKYSSSNGFKYGFKKMIFDKNIDSVFTSKINRYSIGVKKGFFFLKIANGKYKIRLNIDSLRYWNPPFWKKRVVRIQGRVVLLETRSSFKDYLNDFLQFESIEPKINQSPYMLYLKKIFHPIERTVVVKNGVLKFEFESDASGIALNSLFVWPYKIDNDVKIFFKKFEQIKENEYSRQSSNQTPPKMPIHKKIEIDFINNEFPLTPFIKTTKIKKEISFFAFIHENPFKIIKITNNNKRRIVDIRLKRKNKQVVLKRIIYQFSSLDIKHQSYFLQAKYLAPLKKIISKSDEWKLTMEKNEVRYLFIQYLSSSKISNFENALKFQSGKFKKFFKLKFKTLNMPLPRVDLPIGFMGLDPIGKSFFNTVDEFEIRSKYRMKALLELRKRGFSTFSGLPAVKVTIDCKNNKINFDDKYLNQILKQSIKSGVNTIFSYGGYFPQSLIDTNYYLCGLSKQFFVKAVQKYFLSFKRKFADVKIIHLYSDEAFSYSNNILRDIKKAKFYKSHYKNLLIGGFDSMMSKKSSKLRLLFNFTFFSDYSSLEKEKFLKDGRNWGFYNFSAEPKNSAERSFGIGLFKARSLGARAYLDWNLTAINNYPYFDLDGREIDSVMLYPRKDGSLYSSLKFEFATKGLETYRKLLLLEKLINSDLNSKNKNADKARSWLNNLLVHLKFNNSSQLYKIKIDLNKFNQRLRSFILSLQ